MNEPILVSGDDLERVCADIRARGGVVSALETGVGNKNSQYRVSYFQTFPNKPQDASSGTSQSERDLTRTVKGAQVAGHITQNESPGSDKSRMGEHPKAHAGAKPNEQDETCGRTQQTSVAAGDETSPEKDKSVSDAPACISIEDRMDRIRLKAIESGRVTKPSRFNPMREARLPHND